MRREEGIGVTVCKFVVGHFGTYVCVKVTTEPETRCTRWGFWDELYASKVLKRDSRCLS